MITDKDGWRKKEKKESVLSALLYDDNDDGVYIYIYIYIRGGTRKYAVVSK